MGVLFGFAVGIPVGLLVVLIRHWRFLRNIPDGARKVELVTEMIRMRRRGCGYSERMRYL